MYNNLLQLHHNMHKTAIFLHYAALLNNQYQVISKNNTDHEISFCQYRPYNY